MLKKTLYNERLFIKCIVQNQFGLLLTFTQQSHILKKKTSRKHLRFSELSLNCTYLFLNEKENLNSVCLPR